MTRAPETVAAQWGKSILGVILIFGSLLAGLVWL